MILSKDASAAVLLAGCYVLLIEENREKRRKLWQKDWLKRRDIGFGALHLLHEELRWEDKTSFKRFLRMNEDCFMLLLSKVEHKIRREDTKFRESVKPRDRLSITLRFLATGESFQSLSYIFRVGRTTIGLIVTDSINAIFECMKDEYIKIPRTEEEWFAIGNEFKEKWNFPNCCGAIDGKHINFRPSRKDGSYYRNYKGTDSIVLLAAVDANYRFICIDAGTNGRVSDGGVFRNSHLSSAISRNIYNIPESVLLPDTDVATPFVFVADDAFPLSSKIMKPFRYHGLRHEQKFYNYRLSRARRVVENAFGILANRFRIFLSPINLKVEKVERITVVCCILHNFLSKHAVEIYMNEENEEPATLTKMVRPANLGNRTTRLATEIRNTFVNYFNDVGAVPWQNDYINRL